VLFRSNDPLPVTFSITVTNPYAQVYTIEWERIFNGVAIPIVPSTATTYSLAPASLAADVGTHIISVKIVDSSNNIVDTHSFEIKINENPRPVIQSATVTPASYNSAYFPGDLPQSYSFSIFINC